MTELVLEYALDDAESLVRAALERTDDVTEYHHDGARFVAKTGSGFMHSGVELTVELASSGADSGETVVRVHAEREISTQLMAKPQPVADAFVDELETVGRKRLLDAPVTKAVHDESELYDPIQQAIKYAPLLLLFVVGLSILFVFVL